MRTFPANYSDLNTSEVGYEPEAQRGYAFQELIAAALVEETAHSCVRLSHPNLQDGGIDLLIQSRLTRTPFANLDAPTIVQCRHLSPGSESAKTRIIRAWKSYARQIAKLKDNEFERLGYTWRSARSYAFCTTLSIPVGIKQEIEEVQKKFFDELLSSEDCQIESVRVIDWTDLKAWLDTLPRLRDNWLVADNTPLVGHEAYLRSLVKIRKYLKHENLPFVKPPSEAEWSPEALLDLLFSPSGGLGVVLLGNAGVGKSRILIETCSLAARGGSRVLHVNQTIDRGNLGRIQQVILSSTTNVLIAVDYFDRIETVLADLQRDVLQQAEAMGIMVRMLATSRPSGVLGPGGYLTKLFVVVDVQPSSTYFNDVSSSIWRSFKRSRGVSESRSREAGLRPAIALLLAAYGKAPSPRTRSNGRSVRPVDLTIWLTQRFSGDDLAEAMNEEARGGAALRSLVGSALAFAACPGSREDVMAMMQAGLEALGWEDDDPKALVKTLLALGWLEPDKNGVRAPHDIVSDEIMRGVLVDGMHRTVNDEYLLAMYAACVKRPAFLVQIARSVSRALEEASSEIGLSYHRALERWLSDMGLNLVWMLKQSSPVEVSYAVCALLTIDPWNQLIGRYWGSIVRPWLESPDSTASARYVLEAAINYLPSNDTVLQDDSLRWIEDNLNTREASAVLGPALVSFSFGVERYVTIRKLVDLALRWVGFYPRMRGAYFVLYPLLSRDDLKPAEVHRALALASDWAKGNRREFVAMYVLSKSFPRLKRGMGELGADFMNVALDWLAVFGGNFRAAHVLRALLRSEIELGSALPIAYRRSALWCQKYGLSHPAKLVIEPTLRRSRVPREDRLPLVNAGLEWCREFARHIDAAFVLPGLVRNIKLLEEEGRQDVVNLSMQWLDDYGSTEEANPMFCALLRSSDVPAWAKADIAPLAKDWVLRYSDKSTVDFVLNSLAREDDLLSRDDLEELFPVARRWLKEQPIGKPADILKDNLWKACIRASAGDLYLSTLGERPSKPSSSEDAAHGGSGIWQLYKRFCAGADEGKLERDLIEESVTWCCDTRNAQTGFWSRFVEKLLGLDNLPQPQVRQLLSMLSLWLPKESNWFRQDWSFLFQLYSAFVKSSELVGRHDHAKVGMQWLHMPGNWQSKSWRHMFAHLWERSDDEQQRSELVLILQDWMKSGGSETVDHGSELVELIKNDGRFEAPKLEGLTGFVRRK